MKVALIVVGAGVTLLGVGYVCYQKGRLDQWGYDRELITKASQTLSDALAHVDEAMDLIAEASGIQRRNFVVMQPN